MKCRDRGVFAASEWPAWNLCKWAQLNSGKPQVARKCRCRGQPSDAQRLRVDNVTPNSEKIEQQAFDAWKAQPKLAMGPLKQLASYEAVLQMIQAMNSERVRVDHFHCGIAIAACQTRWQSALDVFCKMQPARKFRYPNDIGMTWNDNIRYIVFR